MDGAWKRGGKGELNMDKDGARECVLLLLKTKKSKKKIAREK